MNKKLVSLALVSGMLVSTAASASAATIAYIPKERNESFWQAVEAGAAKAAEDLGVELIMYGDAAGANTAANQSTYVETATELEVDAIVFAALDSDSTDAALQDAQAEGIKVVGFDSDPGEEARDWFVNQVDPDELAKILLDDVVANIEGYDADNKAVVYLVSTNLTTPNQNSWIESIKKAYFSDYEIAYTESGAIDFDTCKANTRDNTYTVKEEYAMLDVKVNPDKDIIYAGDGAGLEEIEAFLSAHQDANFLVSLTTNVIASCATAIESCGLKETCKFNGIATPGDSEAHLKSGLMSTVVLWQAYDLGYLAVNAAAAAIDGTLEADKEFVSNLSGQTQVEGVSTYADAHRVDGVTVFLGGPATFTLDTLDCWKK